METAILVTLFMGIFIIIGGVLGLVSWNSEKLMNFLMSLAIGVIIPLVTIEIMPEVFEIFSEEYSLTSSLAWLGLFFFLGIIILRLLDLFVPDHSHKCEGGICKHNFYHIGIMSFIALFIHDFIEGMSVYVASTSSIKLGIALTIGVGFHNVPLGALIASTLNKATESIKKTILFLLAISLAPSLGGLLVMSNSSFFLQEKVIAALLATTAGMLSYIVIIELLPKLTKNYKTLLSIILGITIMIASMLI